MCIVIIVSAATAVCSRAHMYRRRYRYHVLKCVRIIVVSTNHYQTHVCVSHHRCRYLDCYCDVAVIVDGAGVVVVAAAVAVVMTMMRAVPNAATM